MISVGDGCLSGFMADVTHSTALKERDGALWLSQQTKPGLVPCSFGRAAPYYHALVVLLVAEIVTASVTLCINPEEPLNGD